MESGRVVEDIEGIRGIVKWTQLSKNQSVKSYKTIEEEQEKCKIRRGLRN